MKYLVVVESPAKTKKIQGFLNTISGHTFIVEASFGHIRYFSKGLKSINVNDNFKPTYSTISGKTKVVKHLKEQFKKVDEVVIATDQDREGEAIGFHIAFALNLDIDNTKRICFNEITQKAVVAAFQNSRTLNYDMFNAQQARSILDLLIGFEISPLLWKSIQPKLSAGRCQSPALRLVYERDQLINSFESNKSYTVNATFKIDNKDIPTNFNKTIENRDTVIETLPVLSNHEYILKGFTQKTNTNAPPPPYITSSIQQDASSKYYISPKNCMSILQSLYEKGKITYMRTDSVAISKEFTQAIKNYCENNNLTEYFKETKYKSKVANAQEAHECIRPVSLNENLSGFSDNETKLYNLIKKRVIASQMKKYVEDEYMYSLESVENNDYVFNFSLKKTKNMGFKKIYDLAPEDDSVLIESLQKDTKHKPVEVLSREKHTKPKSLYTEASLIKELEDKGIGRPSTFSSLVHKLLERKYVIKQTKNNTHDIELETFSVVPNGDIKIEVVKGKSTSEKNKLFITDIGRVVCEYIDSNFENINSYTFTSEIESDLDKISNAEKIWHEVIGSVYTDFHSKVEELSKGTKIKTQKNKLHNLIGKNPENDKNIYSYIGKYGPCIQEGEVDDNPKYVSVSDSTESDIKDITLEQALEYLKYPLTLGTYNSDTVYIKKGKFGYYIECGSKKISITDLDISIEDAKTKLSETESNVIKEYSNIKILNGKYGPYIRKGNKNVSIPKDKDPKKLTKKECEDIVKNYKPKKFIKHKKN